MIQVQKMGLSFAFLSALLSMGSALAGGSNTSLFVSWPTLGSGAPAIASDAAGNVYAGKQLVGVQKYSSTGQFLFSQDSGKNLFPVQLALSDSGDIFYGGSEYIPNPTVPQDSGIAATLMRLSPSGSVTWSRRLTAETGDRLLSFALTKSAIYVTTATDQIQSQLPTYSIIKLDLDGQELSRSPARAATMVYAKNGKLYWVNDRIQVVDEASGNVLAERTLSSSGLFQLGDDGALYFLRGISASTGTLEKMDDSLKVLRTSTLALSADMRVNAFRVDAAGLAYVTGGNYARSSSVKVFAAKLDGSGAVLSMQKPNIAGQGYTIALAPAQMLFGFSASSYGGVLQYGR